MGRTKATIVLKNDRCRSDLTSGLRDKSSLKFIALLESPYSSDFQKCMTQVYESRKSVRSLLMMKQFCYSMVLLVLHIDACIRHS